MAGMAADSGNGLQVVRGTVYVLQAFDVGASIDLERARSLLAEPSEPVLLRHHHRAPSYFQFETPPVRLEHAIEPISVGAHRGPPAFEESLYDFGGVALRYGFGFEGSLSELVELVCALSDSSALALHARAWAENLPARLGAALTRPHVAAANEDYLVVDLRSLSRPLSAEELLSAHGGTLARVLRAERGELAPAQVADALQLKISYAPNDLVLIDWAGALVLDRDPEDAIRVLELANLQLMEMRWLDDELDRALDRAYVLLSRPARLGARLLPRSTREPLARLGRLQVDGALLFERVHNALKLLGDPYLARVHRLAHQRFSLAEWNAGVLRKLDTLESIYSKLHDDATNVRMELLEWVIVLLIALEIVLAFWR
jgi:hypothetical protein